MASESIKLNHELMDADDTTTPDELNYMEIAEKTRLPDSSDEDESEQKAPSDEDENDIENAQRAMKRRLPKDRVIGRLTTNVQEYKASPRKRERINPPTPSLSSDEDIDFPKNMYRVRAYLDSDTQMLRPLKDVDREEWGLGTTTDVMMSNKDMAKIYASLDVDLDDKRIQLNTILVRGVQSLSEFETEKIFAEYHPVSPRRGLPVVRYVDRNKNECVITFDSVYRVIEMFAGMSKVLKRINPTPEDGEIMDSDNESRDMENSESEIVHEPSTDPNTSYGCLDKNKEFLGHVEVDIEKWNVPRGKWRVITKHVPINRLLIARYAKNAEVNKADRNPVNRHLDRLVSTTSSDGADFRWEWDRCKVRPGLNVFDQDGRELEWDYEHDTRFYEDPNIGIEDAHKNKEEINQVQFKDEIVKVGDRVIRSRGRGTKKFVLKESDDEE